MGVTEGKVTMKRLLVIAMATALFMSVAVGTAVAAPWVEKAKGGMVDDGTSYPGLAVDLRVTSTPIDGIWTLAHGAGHYSYMGNSFTLRATRTCVNSAEGTVTAWGPANVTAGSFTVMKTIGNDPEVWEWVTLERGDKGYAVLSLLDNGDGTVSARAGIAADFFAGGQPPETSLPTMIAQNCEYPHSSAVFPATGPGEIVFKAK